ncbi:hypothetical protein LWI28_006887 [Acer negundo]|uniref:Uncharacterized protein n=1 Tax=Acer negundo TaxID=4023 RepID=A0AAD5I8W5_ACENE|nr:hypothetical protein LWI28_006887 [Acer negundo]
MSNVKNSENSCVEESDNENSKVKEHLAPRIVPLSTIQADNLELVIGLASLKSSLNNCSYSKLKPNKCSYSEPSFDIDSHSTRGRFSKRKVLKGEGDAEKLAHASSVKKSSGKNKERSSTHSPLKVGYNTLNTKCIDSSLTAKHKAPKSSTFSILRAISKPKFQVTTSPSKPITLKLAHLPLLASIAEENDESNVSAYLSQFLFHMPEGVKVNEEFLIGTSSQ